MPSGFFHCIPPLSQHYEYSLPACGLCNSPLLRHYKPCLPSGTAVHCECSVRVPHPSLQLLDLIGAQQAARASTRTPDTDFTYTYPTPAAHTPAPPPPSTAPRASATSTPVSRHPMSRLMRSVSPRGAAAGTGRSATPVSQVTMRPVSYNSSRPMRAPQLLPSRLQRARDAPTEAAVLRYGSPGL